MFTDSKALVCFAALAACLAAAPQLAHAQEPGTIKLLSKNEVVTVDFAGTEEKFANVTPELGAKYLIIGPVTAQVDYRLHLPPDWTEGPESFLSVSLAGKPYKKFKVIPKLSKTEELPGLEGVRPSAPVGFYLPLGPGAHVIEFTSDLRGVQGASIQVVDSKDAVRKLAQPPPDPPTTVSTLPKDDTEILLVDSSGKITTTSGGNEGNENNTTVGVNDIKSTAGDRLEKRNWAVGAYSGGFYPFESTQNLGGTYGLILQRRIVGTIGVSLAFGFAHMQESIPGDPGQGISPTVISFQYVPAIASLVIHFPLRTRLMPYVTVGAGGLYATSDFEQLQVSESEETFGFMGAGAAGLEIDISKGFDGSEEGHQKIFVQAGAQFASAEFEAHDTDSVVAAQVLAGALFRW